MSNTDWSYLPVDHAANLAALIDALVAEADRFMLRKAHAAALLQWRGHAVPPFEKL